MREQLSTALNLIEEVFGADWLTAQAKRAQKHPRRSHPVVHMWQAARSVLEESSRPNTSRLTEAILGLLDLTANMKIARSLPGFSSTIPISKLQGSEFSKCEFEIFVAALARQYGHFVEFIPPAAKQYVRTADLKLILPNGEIHLECKRKDFFQPRRLEEKSLEFLSRQLLQPDDGVDESYDLAVLVAGELERKTAHKVIDFVRELVARRMRGIFQSDYAECIVSIQQPQSPPIGVSGAWLPEHMNPGEVLAKIWIDEEGKEHVKQQRRLWAYVISAHQLSSIINSFDSARGQIPAAGIGLIYIDVDVSHIKVVADILIYLDLVAAAVEKRFSPSVNTRVGAVGLTIGPMAVHVREGSSNFIVWERPCRVVRNPYSSLPDGFIAPGEGGPTGK